MLIQALLTVFLGHLFFVNCQNPIIKVGFIGNSQLMWNADAIFRLAINDMNSKKDPNQLFTLEAHSDPTIGCSSSLDGIPYAAKLFYEVGVKALIGPYCNNEIESVGKMAAIWNIPIVGYMSTSAALRNKNIYKTLSRVTLTSSNSLANALGLVLQHFNYSQVAIASGRNVAQMADAIKQMLVNNSITLAAHAVFDENATAEIIAASHQLQNIRENARIIIVVFGPQLSAANVFAKAVSLAGMKNSDYLYIYLTIYHGYPDYLPWIASNGTLVQEIKSYYDNSIIIDNDGYANKSVENFFIKVNRTLGFQITDLDSNYIAGYMQLYDAVYVYYKSLLAAIDQANGDVNVYLNGSYIWNLERTLPNASSPQFYGFSPINMDGLAERIPIFSAYFVFSGNDTLQKIVSLSTKPIPNCDGLVTGTGCFNFTTIDIATVNLPAQVPACGFNNEHCAMAIVSTTQPILIILAVLLVTLSFAVVAFLVHRKYKQTQLKQMPWRVPIKDVIFVKRANRSTASLMSVKSVRTGSKSAVSTVGRARAVVGSNHACARIFVQMSSVQLDDKDLRLLFHLQQLVHDNLNPFLGMCFNDPNEQHLMILWKFCSRGSLQELIHNEDIRLEESFKNAFIRDIARGLQFLHSSAIGFHGGLRTSRCLIDNHFVVKLTDFGIEPMIARWKRAKYITNRPEQHSPSHKYLYAAPEMLRVLSTQLFSAPRILTVPQKQAADVYALGMILYEILFRRQPFEDLNTEDVLREIANHSSGRRLFRPSIAHEHENHRDLIVLMQSCWSEEPSARPSIKQVRAMTKRLTKSRGGLVDQMMGVMDQYTNNLEKLIKDRTKQIETTQKQADKLLKQMLPASIAAELKMGRPVQPKSYESATVLFSDIVGFTSLCADSSAMQVINFVNGMFTGFDAIIAEHDANKIETIGDAYMIVSGVPNENDTQHVMNIACVALAMRMYLFNYVIPHRHNQRLKCRIGVNTGPLAAGVVGRTAPKYCLFGDTVQIAALMENSGMPGKIQITNATHSLLVKNYPTFTCTPRGNINIAGKGTFITYWLDGKKKTT